MLFLLLQWPDSKLHLIFCDVGEGDASIIVKGSFQAVIDTGPSIARFDNCYNQFVPFWDRNIEVVYISHQHKDHMGAMVDLKGRYIIERMMDKTQTNDVLRYGNLQIDTLIGVELEREARVLGDTTSNDSSVILQMNYGEVSALFTSDIDNKGELALIDKGVLSQVEILKVAHHGSKFGSSEKFLEAVTPKVAVVSVGAKNSYGHPNGDTLFRLDVVGAKTYRTDLLSSIEIVTDGKIYEVRHRKK